MSKQKDGGSAFPMIESDTHGDGRVFHFSTGGMSYRQWLIGQALPAALDKLIDIDDCNRRGYDWKEPLAVELCRMADKIISVEEELREKQND